MREKATAMSTIRASTAPPILTNRPTTLQKLFTSIQQARLYNTKYMLDHYNINLEDETGRKALSIACDINSTLVKNRLTIINWLMKYGCNFNLGCERGMSLLSWACFHHDQKLMSLLLQKVPMDINYESVDHHGNSALMHAAGTGDLEFVETLLDRMVSFGISVDQ